MGELKAHTDTLLETAQNLLEVHPDAKFLIPATNDKNVHFIKGRIRNNPTKNLKLIKGKVDEILSSCKYRYSCFRNCITANCIT